MTATDETRQALERAAAPKQQKTIYALLEQQTPQIEKALPAAIGAERFVRIVMTELRRSPKLLECKPESLLAAMMLSAQLGLEPGPLGHVYLVPFAGEVTWILGYKGMIELAYRSGRVRDVTAHAVYEQEEFEYFESETGSHFKHRPLPPSERGKERLWYARARLTPSGSVVKVIYREDVEAAKLRSSAYKKGQGPWLTDEPAMCLKTAIRRLQPWLPQSPTMARAVEADDRPVAWGDEGPEPIEVEADEVASAGGGE